MSTVRDFWSKVQTPGASMAASPAPQTTPNMPPQVIGEPAPDLNAAVKDLNQKIETAAIDIKNLREELNAVRAALKEKNRDESSSTGSATVGRVEESNPPNAAESEPSYAGPTGIQTASEPAQAGQTS